MPDPARSVARFRCLRGCREYPLHEAIFACSECGELLEILHPDPTETASAEQWRARFEARAPGQPGPNGSGVWRYREWVLPQLPVEHIVTLGEGNTPLVHARRLSDAWGAQVLVKQCGQSLSGSFKDLGMTVLVSQVHHMRQTGTEVSAVACASTGDTSAALAAYGGAAGLRTLVLLPQGKISSAQLAQPLAHGARVISIDTDFDGCMEHVARLAEEEGVYLANSKNSLRLEGQKTVAFEITQGLGWRAPDWVAIPGGNLGNVSALVAGFTQLQTAGIIDRLPRMLCAQVQKADPLYQSYRKKFSALEPQAAGETQASAIRIGNPVSFPRAVAALEKTDGIVASITEDALARTAREADASGLYVCPHTAVALAATREALDDGVIQRGQTVAVVATAHGLKFTEFKTAAIEDRIPEASLGGATTPIRVPHDYTAVKDAALGD